jgi:hypothetical protein
MRKLLNMYISIAIGVLFVTSSCRSMATHTGHCCWSLLLLLLLLICPSLRGVALLLSLCCCWICPMVCLMPVAIHFAAVIVHYILTHSYAPDRMSTQLHAQEQQQQQQQQQREQRLVCVSTGVGICRSLTANTDCHKSVFCMLYALMYNSYRE